MTVKELAGVIKSPKHKTPPPVACMYMYVRVQRVFETESSVLKGHKDANPTSLGRKK